MDALELLDIIQKGESSTVQFKIRVNDAYRIGTEMVAFTNTNGGKIIIGVDDKTGELKGLSFKEIEETNELLANSATNNVKPPIFITTETVEIDGNNIIVAEISEGISKPYTDNKGIIWVKNGSDKRKVTSREEIARLLQSSGNMYADETIVQGTTTNDIRINFFKDFVSKKTGKPFEKLGLSLDEILTNMGFMKEGQLTLAGLLLFGKNPQHFKPAYTVQCVSFVGNEISTTEYRDKEEPFSGNLSELFEQSISFITRNLKKIQVKEGFNTISKLEIPNEPIEEFVVNSLIHRDYFINTSIKIFIFDNRIEIISPGTLPNTLTIENIKSGISIVRNPVLFSNARYIMPFVGVGTGIPRALKIYPFIEMINDDKKEQFITIINRVNNKTAT